MILGERPSGYVRLNAVETAVGFPLGRGDRPLRADCRPSARQALEASMLRALLAGTVFVTFSGGRDSSAVLAVAAHVARREGLPLPVPVTTRYPGLPETSETQWQELVLQHLRIRDRIVIPVHQEQRLLGEQALDSLDRRGVVWPAQLHGFPIIFEQVRGGILLSGEGGDAVLGPRRITPLNLLLRQGRRPSRRLLAASVRALTPGGAVVRFAGGGAPVRQSLPWIRGEAESAARIAQAGNASGPLRWDAATLEIAEQRFWAVLKANLAQLASEFDVKSEHPLLDLDFLMALGGEGGRWGYCGRTDLMRALFSDVLPDAVLARSSKARFDAVYFGAEERAFARSWDGQGLRADLVDVGTLRAQWLNNSSYNVASGLLLHVAWLASRR